jgi:aspartate aminotransferase
MGRLGTEGAFEVLARAQALEATGRRIIHLEIGEPDFPTPDHIVAAMEKALREGHTHYCPPEGLPVLREACAEHLAQHRRLSVDPANVIIAPGAKFILFLAVLATCADGDEVIYPDPGFPIYESLIRWVGATPIPYPLKAERGFTLTADDLADQLTSRTKLVILNSPSNPTGGVVDKEANGRIAEALRDHSCWILSDEIYSELLYGVTHSSIAEHDHLRDRTIVVDGFSKAFAMTGWRLGYAAVPTKLLEPMVRLMINSASCVSPATQIAGAAALTGPRDDVEKMQAEFARRRERVVAGLNDLPSVSCAAPDGAFYAFPDIARTGRSSSELADLLLQQGGVAVLPGTAFGANGRGHLRLSYANSIENIDEALERMRRVIESL